MKKFLLALLLTLALCGIVSVSAAEWISVEGIEGGQIAFDYTSGEITDAEDTITVANIPSTINGVKVRAIAGGTTTDSSLFNSVSRQNTGFSDCTSLTTVTIPDTVFTIGKYAFRNCTSLTAVVLPDSVTSLQSMAFYNCTSLTTLTLPASVTTIEESTFYNCISLKDVYYNGTESQFLDINLNNTSYENNSLFSATFHYMVSEAVVAPTITPTVEPTVEETATPSAWAAAEVYGAIDAGIVPSFTGDPEYTDAITRLQFAQLIVEMVEAVTGTAITPVDSDTFTDTTDQAVLKAYGAGIVSGYSSGKFAPDATTTRQQIAAMIDRAITYIQAETGVDLAPLSGDLSAFADGDAVSAYAVEAMARLTANGIMNGTTTTTLSPSNTTSVQVSVVLVYRLYQLA